MAVCGPTSVALWFGPAAAEAVSVLHSTVINVWPVRGIVVLYLRKRTNDVHVCMYVRMKNE